MMYSMTPLNTTEEAVLSFVVKYHKLIGKPPTMNEIRLAVPQLHWRSSVRYVLENLVEKQLLGLIAPSNHGRRYGIVNE